MGFLIDTNVLSEIRKGPRANPGVIAWFAEAAAEDLFISVLTLGEIRRGIESIRRRDPVSADHLDQWFAKLLAKAEADGRILPVSWAISEQWGRLNVPDPLPVIDGLLAATAMIHDLILVTRNTSDMARARVATLNPFSD